MWAAPTDGNWHLGSNWRGGQVPGNGDAVYIDRQGLDITVTLDQDDVSIAELHSQEALVLVDERLSISDTAMILMNDDNFLDARTYIWQEVQVCCIFLSGIFFLKFLLFIIYLWSATLAAISEIKYIYTFLSVCLFRTVLSTVQPT